MDDAGQGAAGQGKGEPLPPSPRKASSPSLPTTIPPAPTALRKAALGRCSLLLSRPRRGRASPPTPRRAPSPLLPTAEQATCNTGDADTCSYSLLLSDCCQVQGRFASPRRVRSHQEGQGAGFAHIGGQGAGLPEENLITVATYCDTPSTGGRVKHKQHLQQEGFARTMHDLRGVVVRLRARQTATSCTARVMVK